VGCSGGAVTRIGSHDPGSIPSFLRTVCHEPDVPQKPCSRQAQRDNESRPPRGVDHQGLPIAPGEPN
ncbi:MAG: hypothetical protein AAF550_01325, partial [Myxococcota bacterium]